MNEALSFWRWQLRSIGFAATYRSRKPKVAAGSRSEHAHYSAGSSYWVAGVATLRGNSTENDRSMSWRLYLCQKWLAIAECVSNLQHCTSRDHRFLTRLNSLLSNLLMLLEFDKKNLSKIPRNAMTFAASVNSALDPNRVGAWERGLESMKVFSLYAKINVLNWIILSYILGAGFRSSRFMSAWVFIV